jgi:3',5'-cyclic AMP phosphodiesterase CpdA
MTTILQGSDVHFGKPHDPQAAEYFLEAVDDIAPDIVVIAGDLTQRAKPREYAAAKAFLDRLGSRPTIVTVGNHDVALYRVWERLGYPFRNYRRYISADLDTSLTIPGATFVSLNSAAPRRAIVNGRLDEAQMRFAARVFQEEAGEGVRVLVTHHAMTAPPDGGGEAHLPRSASWLRALEGMGVEVVLSGHLHRAFVVRHDRDATEEGTGGILLVHSGTASSTRGRRAEREQNSFNVVEVDEEAIAVTRHWREVGGGPFEPTWTEAFARYGVRAPGSPKKKDGRGR